MQEPHVDTANTFIIATELLSLEDEEKIFPVLLLAIYHELSPGKPAVVGGASNS